MKILALVLARGGSKGLIGKNIRPLESKPLIAYTIDAALASQEIDKLVVSTDCQQIASTAKRYGAEVPFIRPAAISGDSASSLSGIQHALEWLNQNQSYEPDAVLLLQPTSPFRQTWQIDESIALYNNSEKQSVVGVRELSEAHPMWAVKDQAELEWYIPGSRPNQRQDLAKVYGLNGAIYLTAVDYYQGAQDPMPVYNEGAAFIYPMSSVTSLDINDPIDFAFAKTLINDPDFNHWVQQPDERPLKAG